MYRTFFNFSDFSFIEIVNNFFIVQLYSGSLLFVWHTFSSCDLNAVGHFFSSFLIITTCKHPLDSHAPHSVETATPGPFFFILPTYFSSYPYPSVMGALTNKWVSSFYLGRGRFARDAPLCRVYSQSCPEVA